MRVGVIDIGTNSTRLLIADVDATTGAVEELFRRSEVTRLGDGVDAAGTLSEGAIERVCGTLVAYRGVIDSYDCAANAAVLTSAAREASNGRAFAARVRDDFNLDARILTGDEEAELTFLGAMSGQPTGGQTNDGQTNDGQTNDSQPGSTARAVVIDIGGGSTEFVVGVGHAAVFHVSLPVGVVRMSERHIHSDPPAPDELQQLALDTRTTFLEGLPPEQRAPVERGIAVAGTATSAAAIALELDPYDRARVHGYPLLLATVEELLARVADMTEAERRALAGLHPDRAPTIVAGMIVLGEAMRAFELDEVEVSEHDILHGCALRLAGAG